MRRLGDIGDERRRDDDDDDDDELIRRELIFYAKPGGNFTNALVSVARFPFENDTFLESGHSIRIYGVLFLPGGAEALVSEDASSTELPHLVLLSPLLRYDQRLSDELEIEGCAVEFLWVRADQQRRARAQARRRH